MGVPYSEQVSELDRTIRETLRRQVASSAWHPVRFGPESHFRNKAKLAIGGTREAPTFGILDGARRGVDLRQCGLYEPGLAEVLPRLCEAVTELGLTPYDVATRSGEFKHLVVTHASTGELLVRFVLRSPGQIGRIRRGLPALRAAAPGVRVVSVNLQPEHKAVLAGPDETVLTDDDTLPMPVGPVTLRLRPESFFQTNTAVATRLYARAAEWVDDDAQTLWDLYCGVGGFGLSIGARRSLQVLGVEIEAGAVAGARLGAEDLVSRNPLSCFDFRVGDAVTLLSDERPADVVLVNPPRRGIGPLAPWLDTSGVAQIIYSSCNVGSLSRDLDRLTAYEVTAAQTFDMFPQTHHHEVLVSLTRR